ncbi:hypothetical protein CASFOL_010606 [Castilleja foliolosa]|uniref:Uncharacterized protein n=1 Tax=Castilleja foliolosa TaxID=1961234 RepID=A0ABD3DT38_9LAMI
MDLFRLKWMLLERVYAGCPKPSSLRRQQLIRECPVPDQSLVSKSHVTTSFVAEGIDESKDCESLDKVSTLDCENTKLIPKKDLDEKTYGSESTKNSLEIAFKLSAELVTNQALFPGDSELQQLLHIFRLLGTPNEDIWPGIGKLVNWHEYPQWTPKPMSSAVPGLDENGLHLLSEMLQYEPSKRISAKKAMEHPYFGILGLVQAVLLILASKPLLSFMGVKYDSQMSSPAQEYLKIRSVGAPAVLLSLAMQGVALLPWSTVGSFGVRNFVLCKKPQSEKSIDDEKALPRHQDGSWRSWFNKSLNPKIPSH